MILWLSFANRLSRATLSELHYGIDRITHSEQLLFGAGDTLGKLPQEDKIAN